MELEPIWRNSKIASNAALLYETYRKIFEEDQAKGIEAFLIDFCVRHGILHQLEEVYVINHIVSSGAANVSHKTVEKYQQFEATLKTQAKNFSNRLEELKYNGF